MSLPPELRFLPEEVVFLGDIDRWIKEEYESGRAYLGYLRLMSKRRRELREFDEEGMRRARILAELTGEGESE